jgi:hypothetical protein
MMGALSKFLHPDDLDCTRRNNYSLVVFTTANMLLAGANFTLQFSGFAVYNHIGSH